jgi:hypothetical protein
MPCPKRQRALTKVRRHQYRNPVVLAREWQEALAEGKYACLADLSRCIGVSRARVTQILRLLKLCPETVETISALGDSLLSPIITERRLRPIVDLVPEEQKREINRMLWHYQASPNRIDVEPFVG